MTGGFKGATSGEAISIDLAGDRDCRRSQDPVQRKVHLHCDINVYPSGLWPASSLWDTLNNRRGSVQLVASHPCFQPRNCHGAGITPIMTSGFVMQLLVGSKIIKVDNKVKEDRALLNGAQKLLAILIAIGMAVAYVLCGMYGSVSQLGAGNAILLIIQLSFGSIIAICLDDLCLKGYGICSSISLFIAINTCLMTINMGRGAEFEGAVIALFHLLIARTDKLLHRWYEGNFLVNLPGTWKESEYSGQHVPVWGIAYYITASSSVAASAADPAHALTYIAFMLFTCALFSKTWVDVSGSSARDVAKQLKEQEMVMPGHRESNLQNVLNRYIPTASTLGGMSVGALPILADFMGAIGSATSILLAVTIIYQFVETIEKERATGLGFFGL